MNFEIDFCRLKIQFVEIDFYNLIFQNSSTDQQGEGILELTIVIRMLHMLPRLFFLFFGFAIVISKVIMNDNIGLNLHHLFIIVIIVIVLNLRLITRIPVIGINSVISSKVSRKISCLKFKRKKSAA
jgi:hypothetical protein